MPVPAPAADSNEFTETDLKCDLLVAASIRQLQFRAPYLHAVTLEINLI